MTHEYEAKFINVCRESLQQKLINNGYQQVYPERLMKRTAFHPIRPNEKKWARVRDEGDKITLTIKEIVKDNDIEGVKEAEVIVNDYNAAELVLLMSDFKKIAYQETTREKWAKADIEVMIDLWPGLEPICEVEGPNKASVEQACKQLGFSFADALYGAIDVVYAKQFNIQPEVINKLPLLTFQNPPSF